MCGIAGFVHVDGRPSDPAVLQAMCDVIVHRGPDADGQLCEGPVALGMRRLSIIDVAGGDQPIHTPDRNLSIVYNGECYNFRDLRAELEARGRSFSTHTDTEVVLHTIDEHGLAGVERLRGMYGLAVWDRRRQRLLLVRDRLGQKPLHYWFDGKTLLFGSEIKSLLIGLAKLGLPRPDVCRTALVQYMGHGYVPDPLTIFEGIRKLPPAHLLTLAGGRVETSRYWNVRPEPDDRLTEDEHLDRLEEVAQEAVRLRLISDVPLGAYLSGGVDSSTIVGLMSRCSSAPVKTFSIGFEQQEFDELRYARRVAEHLGTDHHELVVKPDAAALIDDIVRHFDEPFADSSAIPTYYVSKMAREHVTVVLSGDGGDELFAGYSRYFRASRGGALAALPLWLRRPVFGGLARLLPEGFAGKGTLHNFSLDPDGRYVHQVTVGVSEWHRELFSREFAASVDTTDPSSVFLAKLEECGSADAIARRMYADTMIYLPADIMTKVDRMSMMVSLEARAPLLDHVFVEQASRVPMSMKIREGTGKHILRRLAKRLVPPEVIDRRKQGFAVPISQWFNREWMARADELLAGARARGIFRPETVDRLVSEHRRGRRDRSHFLWCLMVLELWFRAYVDDKAYGA